MSPLCAINRNKNIRSGNHANNDRRQSSAINLSNDLIDHGIYAPAIRYPTVARGMARIRITLSSDHTEEEVMHLANTLITLRRVK